MRDVEAKGLGDDNCELYAVRACVLYAFFVCVECCVLLSACLVFYVVRAFVRYMVPNLCVECCKLLIACFVFYVVRVLCVI